jgi:hypothetical protein
MKSDTDFAAPHDVLICILLQGHLFLCKKPGGTVGLVEEVIIGGHYRSRKW